MNEKENVRWNQPQRMNEERGVVHTRSSTKDRTEEEEAEHEEKKTTPTLLHEQHENEYVRRPNNHTR